MITPRLTPHGRLVLEPVDGVTRLAAAFARVNGHRHLRLGGADLALALPPALAYWRDFAGRYVTARCTAPDADAIAPPADEVLASLVASAPLMPGAEYLTADVRRALWT
jgi:non-specific serine/threonine protein kinase